MERENRQYITYVKSLFILVVIVTMVFNPLSAGIANSEITQSPMSSEISQPEFSLSDAFSNYSETEIDDGYWLDAAANGVNLNLNDDDGATSVAFPFGFFYYDTSFSTVYISSNGYLSFTDMYPSDYSNDVFPSIDADNAYCVAPLWDDLIAQNNVYAWSTSEFVAIQYNNIILYPSGPVAGTFQVVFHSNGTLDFNYLEVLNINSATVGLNYGDGVYYNSYPDSSLLGVTTFTLRFNYDIIGSEVNVGLETPRYMSPHESTIINATVYNIGSNDEIDVELSIFLEGVTVSSTTIPLLISGDNSSISYEWTPTTDGAYNFTAYVEPIADELSLSNNQLTSIVVVYSGLPFAFFEDANLLGSDSTTVILTEFGIPYDHLTSADMGVVDLSGYEKVVIASYQSQAFMDRVYANMTWFEEYVADGGILEFHAFPSGAWVDDLLPGGVTYVYNPQESMLIVQPSNPMVTTPHQMTDIVVSNWIPTVWGHMDNLPAAAEVVIETLNGDPVLVEFGYGAGSIIISTQILEYGYFFVNCPLLENILLYSPVRAEHDVSVHLDAPSIVQPGEEVSLNVTVANAGLSSETNLQFGIRINGAEIYSGTVAFLENGAIYEESIPWTEYVLGTYEIAVYVEEVAGEIDTYDNEVVRLISVQSVIRVLWDQGHSCWSVGSYSYFIDELTDYGYIVETTTQLLNNTDLSMYSVLVLGAPQAVYSIEEQDAIEAFVMAGGGLLAFISVSAVLDDITDFAGIRWLGPSVPCNSTDIAVHEVTQDVGSVNLFAPYSILNVTEPAVILVNDTSSNPLVAASEIGLGRVVAIGDPTVLYYEPGMHLILLSDNLVLGINSINWLSEASSTYNITDTQQVPVVVTYMDSIVVACNAIDYFGIDSVELGYRVDGGTWQSVIMTHVSGDEYQGTIPAQPWACQVEYVVCSTNLRGSSYVDDNDGLCYSYLVTDPVLPVVAITAPAPDVTVSGTVSITTTASDIGSGISYVEFYLDGILIGTDSTGPYELEWDSSTVDDGSHTLMVRAYDGAGNDAEASITLITDNPTTTTTTPDIVLITIMVIAGGAVLVIVIVIILKKQE